MTLLSQELSQQNFRIGPFPPGPGYRARSRRRVSTSWELKLHLLTRDAYPQIPIWLHTLLSNTGRVEIEF